MRLSGRESAPPNQWCFTTMKTIHKLLAVAGMTSTLAGSPVAAQNQANTFYFKADAGATWTMDADLKEFFGPVAPDSKVEFDVGPRFGAEVGYNVNQWFATELEFGFMWSGVDTITDATEVDAVFGNAPLLVNLKLELPTRGPVIPYIGAGAGGSFMFLDSDYIELNGTGVWGTETAIVFAYQFFGGVRFRLNDQMSIGIEYRYTRTGEPEFEDDWDDHSHDVSIDLGEIQSHTFSASFTFRF